MYGRYHHIRDVAGQPVNAPRTRDSCLVKRCGGVTQGASSLALTPTYHSVLVLLASRSLILGLRLYFCLGRLAFNSEGGSDSLQVRERRVIFWCISEALSNPVHEIVGSSLVTMLN